MASQTALAAAVGALMTDEAADALALARRAEAIDPVEVAPGMEALFAEPVIGLASGRSG